MLNAKVDAVWQMLDDCPRTCQPNKACFYSNKSLVCSARLGLVTLAVCGAGSVATWEMRDMLCLSAPILSPCPCRKIQNISKSLDVMLAAESDDQIQTTDQPPRSIGQIRMPRLPLIPRIVEIERPLGGWKGGID
jgi:hypothetical protein